jgi:hypothetical protein
MMWGTTAPYAKLTGDSGSAFEALSIGDCRLFRSLVENSPLRLLGLLQQYLPNCDILRGGSMRFGMQRAERSAMWSSHAWVSAKGVE